MIATRSRRVEALSGWDAGYPATGRDPVPTLKGLFLWGASVPVRQTTGNRQQITVLVGRGEIPCMPMAKLASAPRKGWRVMTSPHREHVKATSISFGLGEVCPTYRSIREVR